MKILYQPNCFCQQRQNDKVRHIYPVLMAMEATLYRDQGHEVHWDKPFDGTYDKVVTREEGLPFLQLPPPDRKLTRWMNYQENGNFKYLPATYMQVARDCWWGKCTFCSWAVKYPKYEVRDMGSVTQEIYDCIKLGAKEIFDDSGTFPTGKWLEDFCFLWKDNKAIKFGCNMRMIDLDYESMKNAGFRMVLFGLESANQSTLNKINKGVLVEDYKNIIKASKAGLEPHITVMFGYPWETDRESENTLRLVHFLLRKGYAKTAQSSLYLPNHDTPAYKDGQTKYNHRRYTNRIFDASISLEFWFNKIKDIKDVNDLKYLWKQIKAGIKECL
jgi:radical SAM superfamily enzyme YgiQ (UPF0313 family)